MKDKEDLREREEGAGSLRELGAVLLMLVWAKN